MWHIPKFADEKRILNSVEHFEDFDILVNLFEKLDRLDDDNWWASVYSTPPFEEEEPPIFESDELDTEEDEASEELESLEDF